MSYTNLTYKELREGLVDNFWCLIWNLKCVHMKAI